MRALLLLLLLGRAASADVFATYCGSCHEQADFLNEGHLVPGDAERSLAMQRLLAGEMPPREVKNRPSKDEIAEFKRWIEEMDPPARATRRRVADNGGPWIRWLAVAPDDEAALAKVLNSLSWSPKLRPIQVKDGLARIDLRDFGWSQALWDAVVRAYPYGVAGDVAIRADWFIATATRPPLYDLFLLLPSTEQALIDRLGVTGAPIRAGFTNSGVSAHNRVIERREARHGPYWRSHDFASSTGREDVFAHPLDFVAAGGEIIFTLPNGLQGYMLVDAAGNKLDKAPTAIVTDARRPDRAVVNGLSCMSCHTSGILPKSDQIAAASDDERVKALYAGELETLMKLDAARFTAALEKLAVPTEGSEPIAAAVQRYEAELDRARAEEELGATLGDVIVGGLGANGGTVKREVWEREFARVLLESGAGIPETPPGTRDETRVWIDADERSWLLAARGVTQRRARELCEDLHLALPSREELAAALATGLGGVTTGTLWTAGARLDAHNQRKAEVHDSPSGNARLVKADERHDAVCVQR